MKEYYSEELLNLAKNSIYSEEEKKLINELYENTIEFYEEN